MAGSLDARARGVFDQVVDRSGADRALHIQQSCDGDPTLRARVEALLAAAEKDDEFLREPTLNAVDSPSPPAPGEQPGARIGPYTLVELIGEGGFGSVFLARQSAPVRRDVALKIIKAGMDTKQVIARFEAERQALALMDHPNIARVLEAGATESGRPYFVMELVRGESVTHFCDRERLTVTQRLELFRDVCAAIQHAHQKGIIHRDLKPSNILVTKADSAPLPKVIDFGIAKATAARLTDRTLTELDQFIGTPEYMSPEQTESGSVDIDTRSDIYSLGVLLYELLTGTTPFERRRLASSGFDGMLRIIRDEEPRRPSARLWVPPDSSRNARVTVAHEGAAGQDSSIVQIARRRRSEPAILARTPRRDLDWIVLKCLEKDRTRRYETAGALTDDIGRYLDHQPVLATPPSAGYKLSKFVRRNRGAVLAGAVIAATLLVATGVSIAFAVRASRALATAERNRLLAQERADETRQVAQFQSGLLSAIDTEKLGQGFKELFREQVQASLARQSVGDWPERRKRTAEQVSAELAVYDRITTPIQPVDVARRVFDRYILGDQIEAVGKRFAQQPYVQAELLHTLGVISQTLGLYDKSEIALTKSRALRQVDPAGDDITLAETMSELADTVAAKGNLEEAERLHREALALYRARLGDEHFRTINSLNLVAVYRSNQGDYAGAAAMLRDVLPLARKLGPDHDKILAEVLSNLGGALSARGELAAAEPLTREALDLRRSVLGDQSLAVAESLNNLAGIAYARREYDESWKLLSEALDINRKVRGEEHVMVATLINNLASIRYSQDDLAAAKTLFAEALEIYRRLLGDENNDVVGTLNNLAMMHKLSGDLAYSGPMLREALALRRRLLDSDHPDVALSLSNLADQLEDEGDLAAAETHYREAVEIDRKKLAPCQRRRVTAEIGLLRVLFTQSKTDEAERLLKEFHADIGDAADARCRAEYLRSFVRLYEDRDKANPGNGFDGLAAEWREKLTGSQAATQPATP